MKKSRENQIFRQCPVCGGWFIPAPLHVYKVSKVKGGTTKLVCSWHCMREFEKQQEEKKKGKTK